MPQPQWRWPKPALPHSTQLASWYSSRTTLRRTAEPRGDDAANWLISYFHVRAGRVFDRRQDAAARRAGRHQGRVLRLDPFNPVRPPRARMLGRLGEPLVDVVAVRLRPGPILVLVLLRRVDHPG